MTVAAQLAESEPHRPRTRAECATAQRPCMFISCKHHLYLDVDQRGGSIRLNSPGKEVWELDETCALDVADRGGASLEEIAELFGVSRQRVQQIERASLRKLRASGRARELVELLVEGRAGRGGELAEWEEDAAEARAAGGTSVSVDTKGRVREKLAAAAGVSEATAPGVDPIGSTAHWSIGGISGPARSATTESVTARGPIDT